MDVLLSIRPRFVDLIEEGEKTYEFRDYKPKQGVETVVVYTTKPVGAVTHILTVKDIVERPETIPEEGVGNEAFNEGDKTRFAYAIDDVRVLDDPVSLDTLRELGVSPPQSFQYIPSDHALRDTLNLL